MFWPRLLNLLHNQDFDIDSVRWLQTEHHEIFYLTNEKSFPNNQSNTGNRYPVTVGYFDTPTVEKADADKD